MPLHQEETPDVLALSPGCPGNDTGSAAARYRRTLQFSMADSDDRSTDETVTISRPPVGLPGETPIEPVPESRTTTKELPAEPLRVQIDLDDPESLAEFLEYVCKVIRKRRRVIITIE